MPTAPPTFEDFQRTRHFRCLDGLRAIAVLAVVVYHVPPLGIPVLDALRSAGDLGVDAFFVLSGFLITTLLLREPPGAVGPRLRNFYIRRSLRILPLYVVAIGLYWGLAAMFTPDRLERYEQFLPSLLLYYSDYAMALDPTPFPHFGHAWSLAVEEKYYLLWPIIVMFLRERTAMFVGIGCIGLAILTRLGLAMTYDGDLTARLYYAFDTRYDAIIWGSLLAFVLRRPAAHALLTRILGPWTLVGLVACLVVYGPLASNGSQLRYVAIPVLCTGILATFLVRPRTVGHRALELRPIAYVGRVSYGIYVLHPIAISLAIRLVPADTAWTIPAVLGLGTALSIAMAAVSFAVLESPFLRLKGRYRQSESPAGAPQRVVGGAAASAAKAA